MTDKDTYDKIQIIKSYRRYYLMYKYAYNIDTGLNILAKNANKSFNMECPKCNKKVILCEQKHCYVKKYFKHCISKDGKTECDFYKDKEKLKEVDFTKDFIVKELDNIHNDAIDILYNILLNKNIITISKKCNLNYYDNNICESFKDKLINLDDEDSIIKEYSFNWNNKNYRADIAILDSKKNLKYIIEVAQTHRTEEHKRPDNIYWCELSASDILKKQRECFLDNNTYDCMRIVKCDSCIKENLKRQEDDNILILKNKSAIIIQNFIRRIIRKEKFKFMIKTFFNKKLLEKKYNIKNKKNLTFIIISFFNKKQLEQKNKILKIHKFTFIIKRFFNKKQLEQKYNVKNKVIEKKSYELLLKNQDIFMRNLICASCDIKFTEAKINDVLHIFIKVEKCNVKSNLTVCKDCYYSYIYKSENAYKEKHPDRYLLEYNRIKEFTELKEPRNFKLNCEGMRDMLNEIGYDECMEIFPGFYRELKLYEEKQEILELQKY